MLTETLLMGRRAAGRTFGLRLEELPVGRDGVPKVAVRLCGYIEKHGEFFELAAGSRFPYRRVKPWLLGFVISV